ncbi:hypothetical protein QN277_001697 [Acacia crassicarpa]|uniref:C2H2-type domain-containing protein n=1 Tax=Acacia crassicarpa TaxID=499986 RepID=A0AAE1N7M0_9FABA|nr:hypothetical protein QN277_001697 [Acacia crassicarpa]
MLHQPHTSLAPRKVLLSLPQPSLASSLFPNPSAVSGSSTDSPDVPSNCQNFIVYQAVENSQGTSDVPTTFFNPWRDGSVCQVDRTKIKNPVRCEVCKIDFNSKCVFEEHISGKKHRKKMQLHSNPSNTILSGTSNVKNVQVQDCSVQGQEPFVDAGKDLKFKKRKLLSGGEAEHNDQVDLTSNNDGIGSKKVKVTQCTRCEICMVNCDTKDIYITHLSGKKHLRNLKKVSKLESDVAGAAADVSVACISAAIVTENDKQPASNPAAIGTQENPGTNEQECINSCQPENTVILEAQEKDTETKKQSKSKGDGAGADVSIPGVTAAIVAENDKQPAKNPAIESQEKPGTNKQECVNSCQPENAVILEAPEKDTESKKRRHELDGGTSKASIEPGTLSNANNETVFNLPDYPAQCEICMINCNSKPVYIRHISGKRHKRNMEKVSKSKNDGAGASVADAVSAIMPAIDVQQATNQAIEPQEKLETSVREGVVALTLGSVVMLEASEKDMETKRRKIEPFDGAATTSFRVCKLCNAPCNSEADFNSHLQGKKHAAMVKKLANSNK